MKSIYTDRYGLQIWICLYLAAINIADAYDDFPHWKALIWAAFSLLFLFFAARESHRRHVAKRNGLDPTIVKIVEKNA